MTTPSRVDRLLDAVLLVAGDLELETVLKRIVEAGCALVDARYGALGVIDPEGEGLSAFVHHGIDDAAVEAIGPLPAGRGILGLLIDDPVPMRIADLTTHPASYGFPAGHPPMHSFLGVPVTVGDRVYGNLYLTEKRDGERFTAQDEQLIVGLAAVAGAAIDNARLYDDAQRREQWRDAVLELAALVLAGHPPREVRTRVAELAATLVGGSIACIVSPADPETGELDIVAVTSDELSTGLVPAARSAAWQTLRTGLPVRTDHGQILARPAVWVPVRDATTVVAALGVGRDTPFTHREEQLLAGFGDQASVAWTYDRVQQQAQRLSLVEDRERIGRDLHDTVIQRLFAVGLGLEAGIRRLDDRPDVAERISSAVDEIDATVKHIRTTIFALQEKSVTADNGVRTRVLELVDQIGQFLPAAPRVRFSGPLDTVVDEGLADQVVPVLREALTNVAKHAAAMSVEVELITDRSSLEVVVIDDGVGMGVPDAAPAGEGFGLANLRRRAVDRGGEFELRPGPTGRGTRLSWRVPVT